MHKVRDLFEQARMNRAELDRALAAVDAFLKANPRNPVAMAYLGSLQGMKADRAVFPWVKLKHVNLAISLLDEAYERRSETVLSAGEDYPPDLEILLLRGVAYANFPGFLGRGPAARDSLEQAKQHHAFLGIPPQYRALTYAHLAGLFARENQHEEASRLLMQARETDLATAEQSYKGVEMPPPGTRSR